MATVMFITELLYPVTNNIVQCSHVYLRYSYMAWLHVLILVHVCYVRLPDTIPYFLSLVLYQEKMCRGVTSNEEVSPAIDVPYVTVTFSLLVSVFVHLMLNQLFQFEDWNTLES